MTGPVLVSLGHGYSAAALTASLPPAWRVIGTTRSREKAELLRAAGVEPIDWADAAAVAAAIRGADHILVSIAPTEAGDPVLIRHGADLAAARPRWVGYLSTTGVYGDRRGGWVDEESEPTPVNTRSRWRVPVERAWLGSGLPAQVFRLAGIYGPGRSAFDKLRAGTAQRVVKDGQVFSRIHVADIALGLRAAMERGGPRVVNLADDEPAPPQDVIAYAAGLIGMDVPPEIEFERAEMSPMARSFWAESKRVSNRRLRDDLGVDLIYPDYRAGLRGILAAGG